MTEAEELELLELEAEEAQFGAAPASVEAAPAPEKSAARKALEVAGRIAKGGLEVLDYGGGVLRTGLAVGPRIVAGAADDKLSNPEFWNELQDDSLAAINPLDGKTARTTDELLEKSGVGDLGSVNVMGHKFTGRGAVGLAGDVLSGGAASSALKTAGKGAGLLAKTARAMRAPEALVEKGIESAGKGIYRSGLKAADIVGEKFGKGANAVSDTLLKYNIKGSPKQIVDQVRELAAKLGKRQKDILAEATEAGAKVDLDQVLKPVIRDADNIKSGINIAPVKSEATGAKGVLADLAEQGGAKPAVPAVEAVVPTRVDPLIHGVRAPKAVIPGKAAVPEKLAASVSDASRVKTQVYNMLGDQAYSNLGKTKEGAKLFKRSANRMKIAVEQAASKVDPLLGKALKETNKDLGNLLTPLKKLDQEAAKDIMKNNITQVDTTLGALAISNPATGLPMAGGKLLGKLMTSPGVRTRVGASLNKNPNAYFQLLRGGVLPEGEQQDVQK